MTDTPKTILCPYCGHIEPITADRCSSCGGFFDELSRRVSQQHMGPWFIRDLQMPFRPGCSYEILVRLIEKKKILPNTVLRGPSTQQFWTKAVKVPGVAHLFGICHVCGKSITPAVKKCPHCEVEIPHPNQRDELGLMPLDPMVWEEVEHVHAAEAAAAKAAAAEVSLSSDTTDTTESALTQQPVEQMQQSQPPVTAAKMTILETTSTAPSPYQPVASD